MERRIKEEHITKSIMQWLIDTGWEIVCFDFPQSGTGKVLHPSNTNSKTEGAIIPDIIAYKNGIVVDFENKDSFVLSDFKKVEYIKHTNIYDADFSRLLSNYSYRCVFFGIGMPYNISNYNKTDKVKNMVDFIVFVDSSSLKIIDNIGNIFGNK